MLNKSETAIQKAIIILKNGSKEIGSEEGLT